MKEIRFNKRLFTNEVTVFLLVTIFALSTFLPWIEIPEHLWGKLGFLYLILPGTLIFLSIKVWNYLTHPRFITIDLNQDVLCLDGVKYPFDDLNKLHLIRKYSYFTFKVDLSDDTSLKLKDYKCEDGFG